MTTTTNKKLTAVQVAALTRLAKGETFGAPMGTAAALERRGLARVEQIPDAPTGWVRVVITAAGIEAIGGAA